MVTEEFEKFPLFPVTLQIPPVSDHVPKFRLVYPMCPEAVCNADSTKKNAANIFVILFINCYYKDFKFIFSAWHSTSNAQK